MGHVRAINAALLDSYLLKSLDGFTTGTVADKSIIVKCGGWVWHHTCTHTYALLPTAILPMVWYGMVWYGMVWYGMVWYTNLTSASCSMGFMFCVSFSFSVFTCGSHALVIWCIGMLVVLCGVA